MTIALICALTFMIYKYFHQAYKFDQEEKNYLKDIQFYQAQYENDISIKKQMTDKIDDLQIRLNHANTNYNSEVIRGNIAESKIRKVIQDLS